MALIINKEGLKNNAGGQDLPGEILVRFVPEGFRASNDQKFKLFYAIPEAEYTYQDIVVAYMVTTERPVFAPVPEDAGDDYVPEQIGTEEVTSKAILPNTFVQPLTLEYIGQLEAVIEQAMPDQSTFAKVAFAYHFMVKSHLEGLLGADTVTIRLDLM